MIDIQYSLNKGGTNESFIFGNASLAILSKKVGETSIVVLFDRFLKLISVIDPTPKS